MRQWRGRGLWTYLRWVDRWWLGPAGHWLTLTLSHFSNTEWMDVVAAIHQSKMFSLWLDERHVFGRQWRPFSARTQPSSVWTWRPVKSVMLGWRPGGCNVVVFCCSEGLPCWRVQGLDLRSPGLGTWNEADYSWGCLGRFFDVVVTGNSFWFSTIYHSPCPGPCAKQVVTLHDDTSLNHFKQYVMLISNQCLMSIYNDVVSQKHVNWWRFDSVSPRM